MSAEDAAVLAASRAGRLNEILEQANQPPLSSDAAAQFSAYLSLFLHWNARINLSSIREEEAILSRHFVESIVCARLLPTGLKTLLDFGSGGGFPGIPIALLRPEIAVVLAESQGKKAAFLHEAVRTLGLGMRGKDKGRVEVHGGRAEVLVTRFDCVILRAVDHMQAAAKVAATLLVPKGILALMTTRAELTGLEASIGEDWDWDDPVPLGEGDQRVLLIGRARGAHK